MAQRRATARRFSSLPALFARVVMLALALAAANLAACGPAAGRPTISMKLHVAPETPPDASVIIDEEYIGPLNYVAARGVRLPRGQHRITVEKEGYFPWDQLVEAEREPIFLKVYLVKVPD
jgi:hypothetical protein